MVPSQDRGQAPIVLSAVISLLELIPIWVVHREEDWLLNRAIGLSGLVVDSGVVDGSSVFGGVLIAVLVLNHELLDRLRQFSWHLRLMGLMAQIIEIVSNLGQYKLTKTNGCRDLSPQSELDQVKRVEGREGRGVDDIRASKLLDAEGIAHQASLSSVRDICV